MPENPCKVDGCQIFQKRWVDEDTCICGCHQCFHRRIVQPVKYETKIVYTKCHKIHDFKSQATVDGCQEFTPGGKEFTPGGKEGSIAALSCSLCGCAKGFHRNEITVQVT